MRYFDSSAALKGEVESFQESSDDKKAIAQATACLRRLGFQDERCIQAVAHKCVQQAGKTTINGEIGQGALREIGKCLDRALSRCLDLERYLDPREIARARAALLLGKTALCIEDLFKEENAASRMGEALRATLPQAVPPEATMPMPAQEFE